MILFILSFIAGVLTILAPCTLPLLPLMVGSSIAGGGESATTNKKKALTIAISLGISIVLFTFILKVSTAFVLIPQQTWSIISGVIIIIFGLVTVFPKIWEKVPLINKLSINSNKLLGQGYQKKSFWGDVIIGASLGPVFSTCSPTYFVILATVLPQSLAAGLVDLIAYAVGLSGMVLLVAFLGQKIVNRLGSLSDPNGKFKKILGTLFIILGIAIISGYDKVLETKILGSGVFDITTVEQKLLNYTSGVKTSTCTTSTCTPDISEMPTSTVSTSTQAKTKTVSPRPKGIPAPEITGPTGFINTGGQPITISQFEGKKIVLIDFWTYSCINCQRSLPYVNAWYDKYKDQGLEIIGVHTPEFAFEKVQANVENAVKKLGIKYPVVMDSNYGTWGAFNNNSWPRKYLIDERGQIIYDHVGEGDYDKTELVIQNALKKLHEGDQMDISKGIVAPENAVKDIQVGSPEIYFGASRNEYLANGKKGQIGVQNLEIPQTIFKNLLYLGGTWDFQTEYAEGQGASAITFSYKSKNVYMVASSDKPIILHIYIDNVKTRDVEVSANTLYTLVEGGAYGEHLLRIETDGPGLKAFTFTFG